MKSGEWGPFPRLVEQLAKAAPYTFTNRDYAAARVLREVGGPWEIYAQGPELTGGDDALWPEVLPPTRARPAAPFANHFGTYAEYIYELFADPQQTPCRPERLDREALSDSLVECTFWLGERLKQYLRETFAPFRQDVPAGLFAVSESGLVWTAYACLLDRRGPAAVRGFLPSGPGRGWADGATAADALALHVHAEYLVEKLPSRLPLAPSQASGERRPGGLRRSSFLENYPALALAARGGGRRRAWLHALGPLLRASPLTQIVYADLMRDGPAPEVYAAAVRFGSQAWGHDFWISQVARSLVGAMLSPTPDYELWDEAVREVSRLEALHARRRSALGLSLKNVEAPPELRRARERRADVARLLAEQYVARLGSLKHIKDTSPYLHQRTLDMLVRHVVTGLMPELKRWWESHQSGLPRAGYELFRKPGRFLDALTEVLLRHRPEDLLRLLPDVSRPRLLPLVAEVLDPATHVEPEALARQAGVPDHSAALLLARLLDDDRHGIELPFPNPNHRAPATAGILADFLRLFSAQLPRQEVSVD